MKATEVIEGLGQGVTLFPGLARIFGRNESLLIVQLLYWTNDEKPWTFKRSDEIEAATTLTWREQKTARQHLVALGVLREERQRGQVPFVGRCEITTAPRPDPRPLWPLWR